MRPDDDLPSWKPALDAITGARHGGQVAGALTQLRALDAAHPNVAEIVYQLAWTLDSLDRAAEACPIYERALALGLAPNEHSGALIGLGNAWRTVGELDRAAATLESGRIQFPDQPEFEAYLALVRHAQGRTTEALQLVFQALLDTSADPGITAHQRTLRHALAQLA